jgi:hypothetical protein
VPFDEGDVHRVVLERDRVGETVSPQEFRTWAAGESVVHLAVGAGVDDDDPVRCA